MVYNPSNMTEIVSLDDMKDKLRNNYNEATRNFNKHRRAISWKTAGSTAAITAATSFGLQALMGSGVFAKTGTEAVEGTDAIPDVTKNFADATSQHNLGVHDLMDNNNEIFNVTKGAFQNLPEGAKELTLRIGAGTDATALRTTDSLPFSEYLAKVDEVRGIVTSSHLSQANQNQILNVIKDAEWFDSSGFTNGNLHGMRTLEAIEQTVKAYNASGSSLPLTVSYDSSLSVAGMTEHVASDRVSQAVLDVATEIPGTPGIPGTP